MDARGRHLVGLWSVVGLLLAVLAAATARPLAVGWRCYQLHTQGEHVHAEVVDKLAAPRLVLRMLDGSSPGQGCTAKTSAAHYAALEQGDVLAVVHRSNVPGACELEATIRNSLALLWAVSAAVGLAVLLLVGLATFVHRSLTRPGYPSTHLDAAGKAVLCPACGEEMDEGYLMPMAGVHWRRIGEPVGVPHALRGLPGTVGWRGRPRLHAFRCAPCGVVTFRHANPRGTAPVPGAPRG